MGKEKEPSLCLTPMFTRLHTPLPLALNRLFRASCRFPDPRYWFAPERKIRSSHATLETLIEWLQVAGWQSVEEADKLIEI